ncbi:MAG: hypothetical protein K8R79_02580 [Calditrichales bacterium]|nr:hypothetical protein [Calditrichales bacterium]
MNSKNILDGNMKICSIDDEQGRRYYSIEIAFSENDALTVYRNSIEELLEELPNIIGSAIQARIITDDMVIT